MKLQSNKRVVCDGSCSTVSVGGVEDCISKFIAALELSLE